MRSRGRYFFLIGILFTVGVANGENVWAQDDLQTNSEALFNYEKNLSIVEPIDPTDPPNPIDPGEKPGTTGPLSIDYASDWYFSKQTASGRDESYYAEKALIRTINGQEKEVPNFFQVTDNSGKNDGWILYIQQDGQFRTQTSSLKGAQIILNQPEVFTLDDGEEPTAKGKIYLDPDGQASPVLVASKDQGTGTWIGCFGKDEEAEKAIQLKVPGSTEKEAACYATSFTWTLAVGEA